MQRASHVLVGVAAVLAAGCLSSCEDPGTGGLDPRGSAPFLSGAALSPDSLNLGSLPQGPSGLIAATTATVRIDDVDAGGSLAASVEVYRPSDDAPLVSTPLRDDGVAPDVTAGDGLFAARIQFPVTDADAGRLNVQFSASDELGLRGNTLVRPLALGRAKANAPPELSNLVAPDSVTLPETGSALITMSVAVYDPDGYDDIRDVYFRNLDSPSDPTRRFFLRDDGGVGLPPSGDEFAEDGIFTIIVQLPSTTARGNYRFAFEATDRLGAASATLLHVLTVK